MVPVALKNVPRLKKLSLRFAWKRVWSHLSLKSTPQAKMRATPTGIASKESRLFAEQNHEAAASQV